MADLPLISPEIPGFPVNPQNTGIPGDFNFNVITPQLNALGLRAFNLSEQDKNLLDDIREEIISDKFINWERRMEPFFQANLAIGDSWRIRPEAIQTTSKTLFQSKSGETHRAAETLATVWHRMLFAADPYFEARAMGLNPLGREITESEIYATEGVLLNQQQASRYKEKALTWMRSLATFGTAIAELPFISLPYGYGRKYIEFTDFINRSLILTGFDMSVFDIYDSDYIFTTDFISKWMLRNQASQDTDHWDQRLVENHIEEFGKGMAQGESYARLERSRTRAGYFDRDFQAYENINYHGRLEVNSVMEAYAESIGMQEDPKFVDWSVGILDGQLIAKFHMTQYGDWRTRFVKATYKKWETEPLGYGVGQLGRKLQRNMDVIESLADDGFLKNILGMQKVGKFSGYDQKQFIFDPNKTVELEDINQMAPLIFSDPRVLEQTLAFINLRREDFRNVVGAQTNLQAQITKASATESAIAQTEAIRSAGVHAEIIAESLRIYLEISHVNNLNYLDEPIWTGITGDQKPSLINKNQLPINVGFHVKVVTDKDFRPERQHNLLELLQISSSIRNFIPSAINIIRPTLEEILRNAGMNPRVLNQPPNPQDIMEKQMAMAQAAPQLQNQNQSMQSSAGSVNLQQTPIGPVPTSNAPQPETSA